MSDRAPIFKQIAAIAMAGAFVLAACATDTSIGGSLNPTLRSLDPTASPTPSPKRTKPKRSPTAAPSQTPAAGKVSTWQLKIENISDQFEPDSLNIYAGDKIKFTNKDPDNQHQLVIEDRNTKKEVFAGKVLSTGQSETFVADFKPGEYGYRDGRVPYIVGGYLLVNKRP